MATIIEAAPSVDSQPEPELSIRTMSPEVYARECIARSEAALLSLPRKRRRAPRETPDHGRPINDGHPETCDYSPEVKAAIAAMREAPIVDTRTPAPINNVVPLSPTEEAEVLAAFGHDVDEQRWTIPAPVDGKQKNASLLVHVMVLRVEGLDLAAICQRLALPRFVAAKLMKEFHDVTELSTAEIRARAGGRGEAFAKKFIRDEMRMGRDWASNGR